MFEQANWPFERPRPELHFIIWAFDSPSDRSSIIYAVGLSRPSRLAWDYVFRSNGKTQTMSVRFGPDWATCSYPPQSKLYADRFWCGNRARWLMSDSYGAFIVTFESSCRISVASCHIVLVSSWRMVVLTPFNDNCYYCGILYTTLYSMSSTASSILLRVIPCRQSLSPDMLPFNVTRKPFVCNDCMDNGGLSLMSKMFGSLAGHHRKLSMEICS
jgi:hypothetical protein